MKKFLLLLTGIFLFQSAYGAEGDSLWTRTYGGNGDERANCILPTGDGGFLLAGTTYSFGSGDGDMWLVKVNSQGDSLWSRTYGGSSHEWVSAMVPAGDGGFLLAGGTYSFGSGGYDMWLVKVNSEGDSIWSRTYGGSSFDWANAIISSGDGGFLLAGQTMSFGAGSWDGWLVKVNAQGDSLWSGAYGGYSDEWASSLVSSGGGFLLAGATYSFGAGDGDMWLLQVNAQGDSVWSRTQGGDEDDWASSIIPAGDDFLLAGGSSSFGAGGGDMWLLRVNSQGDSLDSHTYGGSYAEWAYSIMPTGDDGYLLAGWTTSFGAGFEDVWLVKVNGDGDSLWARSYGGGSNEWAYAIGPSGNGDFLLAGVTFSFGAGGSDAWLVCVEGTTSSVTRPMPSIQPYSFVFLPPHPNPFNPTTIASFELRVASYVNLGVYDTAGRLVATLVDGWSEAGTHKATFDGSDLPSGIYLARLTAGDWSAVQKLVLLK